MNEIKTEAIVKVGEGQAVVAGRLTHSGGIIRILSATATCAVAPSEAFAGEVRYSGIVNFKCIALAESGCVAINGSSEFSDRINVDGSVVGAQLSCKVADVNVETVTDSEIRIAAVVDVNAYGNACAIAENVSSCDEDVCVKRVPLDYAALKCCKNDNVTVTDSCDVKAVEVVSYSASVAVEKAYSAVDSINVEGKVYCFAVLATSDGLLTCVRLATPFVKEIAAAGVLEGDVVIANTCLASTACQFESGDPSKINFEYAIIIDACAYHTERAELISDAFCTANKLVLTSGETTVKKNCPIIVLDDVAEGNVALDGDRAAADTVLASPVKSVDVARVVVGDKLTVEGVVCGDIIYHNAEKNEIHSVPFELPFAFDFQGEWCGECEVVPTVTDVSIKVRRESIFDVKVSLNFAVSCVEIKTVSCLTKLERGEANGIAGGVRVHIARSGESVWDAAKSMGVRPEELDGAPETYNGGERILVYKQLKR